MLFLNGGTLRRSKLQAIGAKSGSEQHITNESLPASDSEKVFILTAFDFSKEIVFLS